jgi:hypothetical protein
MWKTFSIINSLFILKLFVFDGVYIIMKIKVIQTHHTSLLEEHVNKFIENVNVVDIKLAHILERNNNEKLAALICMKNSKYQGIM